MQLMHNLRAQTHTPLKTEKPKYDVLVLQQVEFYRVVNPII